MLSQASAIRRNPTSKVRSSSVRHSAPGQPTGKSQRCHATRRTSVPSGKIRCFSLASNLRVGRCPYRSTDRWLSVAHTRSLSLLFVFVFSSFPTSYFFLLFFLFLTPSKSAAAGKGCYVAVGEPTRHVAKVPAIHPAASRGGAPGAAQKLGRFGRRARDRSITVFQLDRSGGSAEASAQTRPVTRPTILPRCDRWGFSEAVAGRRAS